MKVCPKCAAECSDETKFCSHCGESVEAVESTKDSGTLTGKVIAGNFRLADTIGSGAMGAIYKAEQISLGKTVAIKLLHRHLLSDPTLSRRFHREARAASRLNHPNAINIIDFGQAENGALFIAMEFVDGRDLAETLFADYPMSYDRVFKVLKQVCLALDEAHAASIIHRDLKPENIMLEDRRTEKDFVKVLDFGIAKIQDATTDEDSGGWQTVAGVVCGTPEYMAPEQARGEKLDARCDLYSLGVILYQMLTNEMPYTGDSPIAVVTQHLTEPVPDVLERVPTVDTELAGLVTRLMSKDREKRYSTAMQVHRELERLEKRLTGGPTYTGTLVGAGRQLTGQVPVMPDSETEIAPIAVQVSGIHENATAIFDSDTNLVPSLARKAPEPLGTEAGLEAAALVRQRTATPILAIAAIVVFGIGGFFLMRYLSKEKASDDPAPAAAVVALDTSDTAGVEPTPAKPVQKPVEVVAAPDPKPGGVVAPVEQPVVAPVEKPVEKPVVAPVEKPAVAPVEKPVEQPVEKPVEKPVVKPAGKPTVKKPTAKPRTPRKPRTGVKPSGGQKNLATVLAAATAAKRAGNWSKVASAYAAAYKLKKSPKYLKEIGRAHLKSGNQPKACGYFRKFIKRYKGQKRIDHIARLAHYGCDLGK